MAITAALSRERRRPPGAQRPRGVSPATVTRAYDSRCAVARGAASRGRRRRGRGLVRGDRNRPRTRPGVTLRAAGGDAGPEVERALARGAAAAVEQLVARLEVPRAGEVRR